MTQPQNKKEIPLESVKAISNTNSGNSEKQTWKHRRTLPVDLEKLGKMATLKDKIYYLAICGWRIELEERGGNEYLYAIRYIDRKKRRIYLGKLDNNI